MVFHGKYVNIEISKSIMDKRHWVKKCQDRSWNNGKKKRPAVFLVFYLDVY